jgi:hypothetical protein
MSYSMKANSVLAAVFMLLTANVSWGTAVNVDFNRDLGVSGISPTYTGLGAAPDLGTKWNGITSANATFGSLVNSQNVATAVTITVSGSIGGFDNTQGGTIDLSATGAPDLVRDNLASDTGVGTATVIINNLSALTTYNLYLYEVRGATGFDTQFTVTDLIGPSVQSSDDDDASTTGFNNPEDYVLFTGLIPDANNQIRIDFKAAGLNGNNAQYGGLNGFQLVTVPEPSSLILIICACIGMLRFQKRRNK